MDTALARLYDRLSALEQENAMLRSHLQRCEQTCVVLQAEVAECRQWEEEWQTQTEIARAHERRAVNLENCNSPGETLCDSPTETPRDRILEATAAAANALLTIAPLDTAVNTAQQIIGEALDTDRVNVIENFAHRVDSFPYWRVLYEWDSPGTVPQFSDPNAAQGSYEDIPLIYEQFEQGKTVSYRIEEVPEPFRSEQIAIGVKSTHVVPIFVEGQWWGLLGLDDCREAKRRSAAELAMLKIAANCIGSAIQRERIQQALLQAEQTRSQALERHNAELQQTLDRLAESEKRYRTLFELSSEGILRWGYKQPIPLTLSVNEQLELCYQSIYIAEGNDAFAKMYEYEKAEELIGLTPKDFHDRNSQLTRAAMQAWIENRYTCRSLETEEIDCHGRKRYFLNSAVSTIENDCVTSTWISQVDITELRETQQALLQAEQARVAELAKANEELQQREHEVQRSYRLLSVVAQVTKDLLEAEDVEIAIPAALQAVGEVANMSRVQLLLEHQDSTTQKLQHVITYEWVAEGIVPQINHPDAATLDNDDFEFMLQDLYIGRSIWRLVDDFPNPIRAKFESIGIKSSGTVPIFIEGRYIGGVGFDDCATPRQWSQQEIDVLTAAAESIGAALHRKQLVDRLVAERIHAEQERAAELKKANEALARTSQRLAEQPDLSAFLSHIALEAIAQLGADGAMLSILDEQRQVLRAVAHVEQGHIPVSTLAAEMPVDEAGFVKVLIQERKPRYFNLEQEAHLFWKGSVDYHRQHNHQAIIGVPLFAGGNFLGHLGLAFTHTNPIKEQSSELLYALAQQAALAIQLTRLAEEAKQAAIAREQEKAAQERAEQLARANNALQKTVAALTTRRDLDGFIGEVLHTLARELDSPLVEYWTVLGIDTVEVDTWMCANQLFSLRQGNDHPSRGGIRLLREYIGFEDFTQRSQAFTFDAPMPAYSLATQEVICPTDWYAARGVTRHFNFPLQAGDITIGSISVWMPFDREISEESLRLGQTLSHQTALAIQLTRLAEEAKQAAIAREQEKAAQERAAELAKANEALRRSARNIARNSSIEDILPLFLHEAIAVSGAGAGAVLRRVGDSEFEFVAILQGDDLICGEPLKLHPFYEAVKRVSREDPTGWFTRLAAGETLWRLTHDDQAGPLPESGDYHRSYQQQSVWDIPYKIGDRVAGYLGLAFHTDEGPSQIVTETVTALATQVGLALELTELAEEAKQAAISREQEKAAQQRAAELAKANEVLSRTSSRLAEQPDLSAFLGHIMLEAVAQLEADGGHLTIYDQQQEMISTAVLVEQGKVVPSPDFPPDMPISEVGFIQLIRETRKLRYFDLEANFEQDAHLLWQDVGEHHKRRNHLVGIAVPLFIGDEFLGHFGLAFSYKKTINEQSLELLQALANQAALAIQLTRLAEAAKQAAIAREQEKAAQERAAELAKANDALKRAVSKLSEQPELNAFLGHVLTEVAEQIGACSNALFTYDRASHTLSMKTIYLHGQLVDVATDPRLEIFREPVPADISPAWQAIQTGWVVTHETDGTDPNSHPQRPEWHREMGHETVIAVPLVVGGKAIGFMAPCFRERIEPNPEKIELIQSLAHQATLALELTRLAEEAKQAAIAREQEKAAQQQAAELCRANILLRNSLSHLSTSPNLKDVLGHLLVELVRYAGASVGHIFIHDATQNTLTLSVRCQDRQAFWTPADDEPVLFRSPISVEHTPIFTHLCAQPRLAILNQDEFEGRMWEGVPQWFEAKGYRGICSCVLMVGDRPFGMLAMAFPQPVAFRSVEEELILALTQQIALVIQLTTLGEADKQAAIAREQEKAAQERAAELAKANDALKRSLNSLAAAQSLDRFIENVMTSLAEQFDSTTAEYWSHPDGETAFLELLTWEGTFYNRDAFAKVHPDHPGLTGYKVPPEMILSEPLNRRTQHFIIEDTSTHPDSFRNDRQWMYKYGIPKEINVPLNVGENTIGAFVVRMQQNVEITTEKVELAWALANQVALALELTRLAEEAKQAAIFEERNRMAREIHDTLAQAFTGISLQLEVAKSLVYQDPQTLQQILDHLSRLAETGLAEARRSVWALYPPAAEYADLAQMLYESVEQMTRNTSTSVEVNLQGTPCALPPLIGMNLLRIGQEAITNALKHAQAQTIAIELSYEPDRICLTIGDNGCGFTPPTDIDSLNGGFGLMGMYERCDRIGAQLSLTSQLGQGTQILVEAPLS